MNYRIVDIVSPKTIDITTINNNGYCVSSPDFALQATPVGGDFYGNGVSGNSTYTFSPLTAGVGDHNVTYLLSSSICQESASKVVLFLREVFSYKLRLLFIPFLNPRFLSQDISVLISLPLISEIMHPQQVPLVFDFV